MRTALLFISVAAAPAFAEMPQFARLPPIHTLPGGSAHAECAALFGLLEREDGDEALRAEFAGYASALRESVARFHGESFVSDRIRAFEALWRADPDALTSRPSLLRSCAVAVGVID